MNRAIRATGHCFFESISPCSHPETKKKWTKMGGKCRLNQQSGNSDKNKKGQEMGKCSLNQQSRKTESCSCTTLTVLALVSCLEGPFRCW